jgi:hypothetical protein
MSIWIADNKNEQKAQFQFTVDENGVFLFEGGLENTVKVSADKNEQFQLLGNSRYSFFGCWLYLVPLSNLSTFDSLTHTINKKPKQKRLFLYRDSLSAEEFSRLSQVIRKLSHSS